jgi:ribosome maturation factor RimP
MDIVRIENLLEPLLKQEGAELVDVHIGRDGHRPLITLYLDKPGGISLDDCAYLSERIGSLFDTSGLEEFERPYTLEVSSPGLDRVIKKEADFKKFTGKPAVIALKKARDGRHRYRGILRGLENGRVLLDAEDRLEEFALDEIAEARLDESSEALKGI